MLACVRRVAAADFCLAASLSVASAGAVARRVLSAICCSLAERLSRACACSDAWSSSSSRRAGLEALLDTEQA
jgi:hypothetical protein